MKKIIALIVIFCAFNVARVEAQIDSKPVAEFEFTVPTSYDHDNQIDVSVKRAKLDKLYSSVENLTSENFAKVTNKLVSGKTYIVKIFEMNPEGATSQECLAFLKNQDVILVGAQGLTLVYDLMKEKLPKDKVIFSFDKKENLWTSSDGNHGIPFLRTYTKEEGDYAFGVNTFEYDFVGNNGCLMAFFEK
ncbi:MAG: hypothetical protein UR85_C0004G0051 [Candidatus Nomurabacteria bacterium GW2011_GWF2_35_66]|uniref:Uncharacterized protein n=1 Tax=Candidatus Nomurabacteria bacterium GW2011_GWE1_35_16 TaxID=1618761 RepID=A0A0G0BSX8_9BACT|nr:MAG: hypothetical protein UR55_C0002G0050 [Candidatus Nomurabacteria bacterium GW2011_GWF1_34_20]KKP63629.1 MAG: hypothetical protein UR57_C0002G0050 [Candidatus Nomurabacteria bacterium GW2011_GWE2_34_25]KKP66831.1 MAG: hypothetical protein UR64_C0002G0047 [Candidatus Nomurabacteria bacterium GW2011_GWE1_35_16]KKP83457.1 MAG: hypothetical protein UR85_C0004G0051 [Candidatus Nomurabacteria bacterium GW2011_GWF2_35_66]HAE36611.1 hypothetical protein [Candidatus Nomurabacteria bacterium]